MCSMIDCLQGLGLLAETCGFSPGNEGNQSMSKEFLGNSLPD